MNMHSLHRDLALAALFIVGLYILTRCLQVCPPPAPKKVEADQVEGRQEDTDAPH